MKPSALIILKALRRGEVLTNQLSKQLYGVEALSQRCGEINSDPSVPETITSVRVPGKPYHKHYIKGAIDTAVKEVCRVIPVASYTRRYRSKHDDEPAFDFEATNHSH